VKIKRAVRVRRASVASLVLVAICSVLTSVSASAATPGQRLWLRSLPGDSANALAVAPDGTRVFVGGSVQLVPGEPTQYQTAAYDADGTFLWSKIYLDGGMSGSTVRAIAVSPNGKRVFVTGESYPKDGFLLDIATVAYRASDGTRLWTRRYDGPAAANDNAFAIGASRDGMSVFVSGVRTSAAGSYDYVTIAYDAATGQRQWLRSYDGSGEADSWDVAYSLDVSGDGSMVVVTGLSAHADGAPGDDELTYDVATVSYDAATGARNWVSRFNGAGDVRDYGLDVVISPDSSKVFVVGQSGRDNAANYADFVTLAYDAQDGGELWSKLYDGPAHSQDSGNYIAVAPDGATVIVTGSSIGSGGTYDIATVAYDTSDGSVSWAKRYAGSGSGDDTPSGIVFVSDGSAAYVVGSSVEGGGYPDFVTLAYETASGSRLWRRGWDSSCGFYDRAYAIGASPLGGRVFVTGTRACSGEPGSWVTIAYGA
jgi:hypothetical protein